MNNFFSNLSMIFLEDDATPEQTEDYSIDMEQPEIDNNNEEENKKEDKQEISEDENNNEDDDMDLGEESDDYSIDMEQPSDTGEETTEEDSSTDDNDISSEEQTEENNNDEVRYKKYKLLFLYKEILNDINKLSNSLKSFRDTLDRDLEQHQIFVEEKINNLNEKIEFTLRNDYLTKGYEELLTSYLYFREELDAIVELISKLINYNNE